MTDAAIPGDELDLDRTAPTATEVDLDAIEADLDRVERALDELADGTYWKRAPQAGPVGPSDPTPTDAHR